MQRSLEDVYEEYISKEEVFEGLKFTRYVQLNYGKQFKYVEISKFLKSHASIIDEFNKSKSQLRKNSKSRSQSNLKQQAKQVLKVEEGGDTIDNGKKTPGSNNNNNDNNTNRETAGSQAQAQGQARSQSIDSPKVNSELNEAGEQDIEIPKEFLDSEISQPGNNSNGNGNNNSNSNNNETPQGIGNDNNKKTPLSGQPEISRLETQRLKIGSISNLAEKFGQSNQNKIKSHNYYIPKRQSGIKTSIDYSNNNNNNNNNKGNTGQAIKIENWHNWNEQETRLFLKSCVLNSIGNKANYLAKIVSNCNLIGNELTQLNSIALKIMGIDNGDDRGKLLMYIRNKIFSQARKENNDNKFDINMDSGMCIICINKYQIAKEKYKQHTKINFGHLYLCQDCYTECNPYKK